MKYYFENTKKNINSALVSAQKKIYKITNGNFPDSLFSMAVKAEHIGTDVKIFSEDEDSVTIGKTDKNGNIIESDFRILTTTDLHLGDMTNLRNKTISMLMNHIKATKPDLIIFTGDIILSSHQHSDAVQFAEFMEKIGIYWAYVFGNHEAREEKGSFKHLLMKCMADYPHCLMRQGDKNLFGYGNYCINIMKSKTEILKTLYCLDSGRDIIDCYRKEMNVPSDVKGYDYLKKNQIAWYENKVKTLKSKSFMYMHIPLKEYENVIENEPDENGKYQFTDKCKVIYGEAYESVGSSPVNSGMFDKIKELDSTQAVFSGHDHVNDFCAVYDGVYLVYSQCDGYETYTMYDKQLWPENRWILGVTITDIEPSGSFEISPRYNRMYM